MGTMFRITPAGWSTPMWQTPNPARQVPQAEPHEDKIMQIAAPMYPLFYVVLQLTVTVIMIMWEEAYFKFVQANAVPCGFETFRSTHFGFLLWANPRRSGLLFGNRIPNTKKRWQAQESETLKRIHAITTKQPSSRKAIKIIITRRSESLSSSCRDTLYRNTTYKAVAQEGHSSYPAETTPIVAIVVDWKKV